MPPGLPGNPTARVTSSAGRYRWPTGQTRTQLLHLSGLIEAHTGSVQEAFALLAEAADASTDPSLTIELLFEAADAASFVGDPVAVVELGQRAARISPADERTASRSRR